MRCTTSCQPKRDRRYTYLSISRLVGLLGERVNRLVKEPLFVAFVVVLVVLLLLGVLNWNGSNFMILPNQSEAEMCRCVGMLSNSACLSESPRLRKVPVFENTNHTNTTTCILLKGRRERVTFLFHLRLVFLSCFVPSTMFFFDPYSNHSCTSTVPTPVLDNESTTPFPYELDRSRAFVLP